MALDKQELKVLLRELKRIFVTKEEMSDSDINTDILMDIFATKEELENLEVNIDSKDVVYVGDEEPENDNVIWFDSCNDNITEITYENPVIDEIFASIQSLQEQVKQLQKDVEYLKIYGGGGSGELPEVPDDNEDEVVDVIFSLEDGGLFLLEDGGYLILEESKVIEKDTPSSLSLEDGSLFLLEDGGYLILEENINKITESLLLLENGARLLYENGTEILLEGNNFN